MLVDASDATSRMLASLERGSELLEGDHEFTLFTTIAPTDLPELTPLDCGSLEDVVRDAAAQVLRPAEVLARRRRWNLRTDYALGAAVPTIVAKAEAMKADLILMGTRARTPIGTALSGSVASGVLAACDIPVLLIRSGSLT